MSQPATNSVTQPDSPASGLGSGDGFGVCPECGLRVRLKKDGTLPIHREKRVLYFGTNWHRRRPWCNRHDTSPNKANEPTTGS